MLSEEIEGKPAVEVAALGREDVVELLGIQLSPVRLKCALLGLGVVKVALNSSVGAPRPEGFEGRDEVTWPGRRGRFLPGRARLQRAAWSRPASRWRRGR